MTQPGFLYYCSQCGSIAEDTANNRCMVCGHTMTVIDDRRQSVAAVQLERCLKGMPRSRIYIAGKITGDSNYRDKFRKCHEHLEEMGHLVMNPTILPEGFPWATYMPVCFAMIDACDKVLLLPDWKDSRGAQMERIYAETRGKQILEYVGGQ